MTLQSRSLTVQRRVSVITPRINAPSRLTQVARHNQSGQWHQVRLHTYSLDKTPLQQRIVMRDTDSNCTMIYVGRPLERLPHE